ncbi:MAG: hypothetical protein ACFNS9_09625, partial [Actinomyces sp.]
SYEDFSSKFTTIDMTVKPQGASATAAASPDQGGQGGNGDKGKKNEPSASMTEILTSHSTIFGSIFGKKSAARPRSRSSPMLPLRWPRWPRTPARACAFSPPAAR